MRPLTYGVQRVHIILVPLAVCFAVLSTPAAGLCLDDGHNWELFVIDDSGALWLIDKGRAAETGGGMVNLRIRYVPLRGAGPIGDLGDTDAMARRMAPHDYSDIYWTIDCSECRLKTTRIVRFDRGRGLEEDFRFDGGDWSQPPRGSIPARIAEKVCGSRPF